MVPYVNAVVAVTVMRVLLFVLHVCMLRDGGWMDCGECKACGWCT